MASSSKRSWKLQEIMAHDAGVNCLALGHKSGRVLATGGDDKKVNLFAVGKPTCIMTLTGHTTPIDCVRFNVTEELVCAGSQTGALKVWDLEAAKLVRSLTGHKSGISCMDFHPYGDFLTTGSNDHSIKLWDVRRRGCIISFKGHVLSVNNVKFSPDGQWIASSGADGLVKLWDLRANKVIHEFNDHTRSVTSVEFHPHDFLLATGGLDRTVNFFELEHFKLVSSEKEVGAVKCLWFHPDGECLFTGVTDGLRIQGWEPAKIYDTLPVGWGKVHDIATANTQLIGASIHLTHVSVYVVDLQKVQPFGEPSKETNNSPFTRGQSVRKSFTKEKPLGLRPKTKTKLDVKTIEESTSGTDQEEDNSAGITYIHGYREVFKPNRALLRTPPPVDEPFTEPVNDIDPSEPQIITADEVYSLSIEDLGLSTTPPRGHVPVSKKHSPPELLVSPPRSLPSDSEAYVVTPIQPAPVSRAPIKIEDIFNTYNVSDVSAENDTNFDYVPPKYELQRQYSNKEISEKKLPTSNNNNYNLNGIKHSSSEVNLNINSSGHNTPAVTRANSFSRSNRSNSKIPTNNRLNDEHNFKESKQQQQQNKPTFKKPDPPKPLGYNDDYGSRRHKPLEYDMDVGGHQSPVKKKYDQIPTPGQQPIGIDLEQFLPKNLQSSNYINRVLEQSNTDILAGFTKAHTSIRVVLHTRIQSLRTAYQYFESSDDAKVALERVMKMDDNWVAQDILRNLMARQSFWSLAVCAIILPTAHELIKSRVDLQNETGCEVVRATLRNFSSLIRSNVLTPCSGYSVDIPREERYEKCRKCYDALMVIRDTLETKQHVSCKMSSTFKDLYGELNKLCVE